METADLATKAGIRRRVTRMAPEFLTGGSWTGVFHVTGDVHGIRQPCKVVDISLVGMGIEVQNWSYDSIVSGLQLIVELSSRTKEDERFHLGGKVRHVTKTDTGVRVGIEFGVLSEAERRAIALVISRELQ